MRILLLLSFLLTGLMSKAEFKVPSLQGPVMDLVGVLQRSDSRELSRLLYDYNQRGKAQIQVLIVQSLEGEEIEQASIKITDTWKLGDKKRDNGILFLIAVQDRKLRIEVGQGLEGALPDVIAKRIISDTVIPLFRAGRSSDGVVVGVHEIILSVDKEFADNNNIAAPEGKKNKSVFMILFVLFVLITIARSSGGRGGGGSGFGRGVLTGGLAGGIFGGGGGGGGGSSWSGGGGGGGFSGGGASGSW